LGIRRDAAIRRADATGDPSGQPIC